MNAFAFDCKKEAGEYVTLTEKGSKSSFLPGTVIKKQ